MTAFERYGLFHESERGFRFGTTIGPHIWFGGSAVVLNCEVTEGGEVQYLVPRVWNWGLIEDIRFVRKASSLSHRLRYLAEVPLGGGWATSKPFLGHVQVEFRTRVQRPSVLLAKISLGPTFRPDSAVLRDMEADVCRAIADPSARRSFA